MCIALADSIHREIKEKYLKMRIKNTNSQTNTDTNTKRNTDTNSNTNMHRFGR